MGESIQYFAPNQNSIFGLRKLRDITEPVMDEMLDKFYSNISERTDFDSHSYDKLDIDQIRSIYVTSSSW